MLQKDKWRQELVMEESQRPRSCGLQVLKDKNMGFRIGKLGLKPMSAIYKLGDPGYVTEPL